jgi:hypothetical protein
MVEELMQYLALENYKGKAMQILSQQRASIMKSRQNDFDKLLQNEFMNTSDSLAVVMRSALVEPTDEMLLNEAMKWYGQRQ